MLDTPWLKLMKTLSELYKSSDVECTFAILLTFTCDHVTTRWGVCDMATCAEEVAAPSYTEAEAKAEFRGRVIGIVKLKQVTLAK